MGMGAVLGILPNNNPIIIIAAPNAKHSFIEEAQAKGLYIFDVPIFAMYHIHHFLNVKINSKCVNLTGTHTKSSELF